MPRRCLIPSCFNIQSRPRGTTVSFHRFPARNPQRLRNWMIALYLDPDTPYHRVENLMICSAHFVKEDFIEKTEHRTGSKRYFLNDAAVPSVGLPRPQTVKPEALTEKAEHLKDVSPRVEGGAGGIVKSEPEEDLSAQDGVSRIPVSRDRESKPESVMCSVVGCDSYRRSAQQLKLPEDSERRLEWVQFVLQVNGQQLKESRWTDITICSEHFTKDCFVKAEPEAGTVQLRPGAVPSLYIKSEPDEPAEIPVPVLGPSEFTSFAIKSEEDEPVRTPEHVLGPSEVTSFSIKSEEDEPVRNPEHVLGPSEFTSFAIKSEEDEPVRNPEHVGIHSEPVRDVVVRKPTTAGKSGLLSTLYQAYAGPFPDPDLMAAGPKLREEQPQPLITLVLDDWSEIELVPSKFGPVPRGCPMSYLCPPES
ncbi:uncharacterized protein LOC115405626 isoform X2 [Salarias fasciatus]|uniref:uncharacterized protein LOC115405626 isoform X2 n=1 Tax=Salarias fasciatus TaxID=181472 RepID=UPI001176F0EF|nr:uncharacterized protein LOC115405626 isoform X2 [Salarias fasciatus]